MKKLLIVKIMGPVMSLIAAEINCESNDEAHIKRTIESTRNPNVLSTIITQNMSRKDIFEEKSKLDKIREDISKADTIEVNFLPIECNKQCETCIINNLHEKLEALTNKIGNNALLSRICPN